MSTVSSSPQAALATNTHGRSKRGSVWPLLSSCCPNLLSGHSLSRRSRPFRTPVAGRTSSSESTYDAGIDPSSPPLRTLEYALFGEGSTKSSADANAGTGKSVGNSKDHGPGGHSAEGESSAPSLDVFIPRISDDSDDITGNSARDTLPLRARTDLKIARANLSHYTSPSSRLQLARALRNGTSDAPERLQARLLVWSHEVGERETEMETVSGTQTSLSAAEDEAVKRALEMYTAARKAYFSGATTWDTMTNKETARDLSRGKWEAAVDKGKTQRKVAERACRTAQERLNGVLQSLDEEVLKMDCARPA